MVLTPKHLLNVAQKAQEKAMVAGYHTFDVEVNSNEPSIIKTWIKEKKFLLGYKLNDKRQYRNFRKYCKRHKLL